jgi:CheY-like chemotaxis protein
VSIFSNPEFWKAIANLGWPVSLLVVFFFMRKEIRPLLQKDQVTIKIGSFEINVADATKKIAEDLTKLQKEIAEIKEIKIENSDISLKKITLNINEEQIYKIKNDNRILWADDYPENNAFIIETLSKEGWIIDCVGTTSEAMKRFSQFSYDAIISDLGRFENGKDNPFAGLDLIELVKKEDPKIPILIFAGDRGMQNKSKLIAAGAADVTDYGSDVFRFISNLRTK